MLPYGASSPVPRGRIEPDSTRASSPFAKTNVSSIDATEQSAPVELISQETFPLGAWNILVVLEAALSGGELLGSGVTTGAEFRWCASRCKWWTCRWRFLS